MPKKKKRRIRRRRRRKVNFLNFVVGIAIKSKEQNVLKHKGFC